MSDAQSFHIGDWMKSKDMSQRGGRRERFEKPVEELNSKLFGTDLFGDHIAPKVDGVLKKRFLIPPFSVLNAREGVWQERKRAWIALGIKSELGRGSESATGGSPEPLARLNAGQQSIMNKSQEQIDTATRERESRKLAPGGSPRPACDYSNRQRGDGSGKPIV